MTIYVTLDDDVLDLSSLSVPEAHFFGQCYALWKEHNGLAFEAIRGLIFGEANPILKPGGRVTKEVASHPLFRAVTDLEARIGVMLGRLSPDRDDERPEADPLGEEFVSIADAARAKGTTVPAVHAAIRRGDLIAIMETRPAKVSKTSLGLWAVDTARQRSARKAVSA